LKSGSEGRHDSLVSLVRDRLVQSRLYDLVETHIIYKQGRICGEIDVYGVNGNKVVLFEAKCNLSGKNYRKAVEQLNRAEMYCFPESKVYKFIVHYNLNSYTIKKVK
jgi:hypothetical protein